MRRIALRFESALQIYPGYALLLEFAQRTLCSHLPLRRRFNSLIRLLDLLLIVIFFVSVATLLLSHDDAFVREILCAHTGLCPVVRNAKAWNKICYDLAVGTIITQIFYVLFVRLPDYQRRKRFKKSLKRHYRDFRIDCIEIMLLVVDGQFSAELPERLLECEKFREYFKHELEPGLDRWHKFHNEMTGYSLHRLLTRMEILRDEIAFVLNNTDIPKEEPFEFLKRLSDAIYSMKGVTVGYDELKPLGSFLWSVFAGWDWSTGYRREDLVKKMIDAI